MIEIGFIINNYKHMGALEILIFLCICSLGLAGLSGIPFQNRNIYSQHLICMRNRGLLDEFFVAGELESTEIFKFLLTSVQFEDFDTYSLKPHFNITLESLYFYFTPEVTAGNYASVLKPYNYKMLWFDLTITGPEVDCNRLWIFINTLQKLTGKAVGIIANKDSWVDKFGSVTECTQFSTFPLFLKGEEEFQQFAGWSTFIFKEGKPYYNVCNIDYTDVEMGSQSNLQKEQTE